MRRFMNIITESMSATSIENLPKTLYHATFRPYLNSIIEHGLGGISGQKNYDASESGVVYLATSPEIAFSYAEVSEEVPAEYIDMIVVLSINTSEIDADKLSSDPNVMVDEPEFGQTFAYRGVIRNFEVI